jgi:8-oxo-dGTP diphosphatase
MAALASTKINVTVVRALIESDGRILLVRRAAWDTRPGQWELPGGKVDRGEPRLEALARELEEETELMLAAARALGTRDMRSPRGRTVREHLYAVTAIGEVALSDEHDGHIWVQTPGALELTDSAAAAFSLA